MQIFYFLKNKKSPFDKKGVTKLRVGDYIEICLSL